MTQTLNLSRRDFLKVGATAMGGLLVSFYLPESSAAQEASGEFMPNAFLRIDPDDSVSIWSTNPEIGQGVKTALPMIVAEELEADWTKVKVVQAELNIPVYGRQGAGGSWSVHYGWDIMRNAGATAREMLIAAAAQTWGVDRAACRARSGEVIHADSGQRLSFGALAARAADLTPPEDPPLKDSSDFRLLGTRVGVVDARDIVTGKAVYGFDVKVPGMLYAAIAKPPFGGQIARFDEAAPRSVPGVRNVIALEGMENPTHMLPGVAVVADSTWAALEGVEKLNVEWTDGPHGREDSSIIWQKCEELLAGSGTVIRDDGDVIAALGAAAKLVEATYELPFLAHAPMEPVNCTADARSDRCEMRGPMQAPSLVNGLAAAVTGLPRDVVRVIMPRSGGGFGRRLLADYAAEAAFLSKTVGAAVMVVRSREDDLRNDYYRPAGRYHLRAGLDQGGRLVAWHEHDATTSRYLYRNDDSPPSSTEVFRDGFPAGIIPNFRLEYSPIATSVPTGAWRGPGHNSNGFIKETFLDEIAHAAGRDPVDLRLELLGEPRDMPYDDHGGPTYNTGRFRNVIQLAAEKAGWGQRVPQGVGRGLAAHFTFGSYVAHVVDVSVDEQGNVRVHRVVSAVDCGVVVNRSGAEAQIEGGIIDGINTALNAEITIADGRVEQSNFHNYSILPLDQAPEITVHFVPSMAAPFGLGEMALPPMVPALGNAIFAATGTRIRRLPVRREELVRG